MHFDMLFEEVYEMAAKMQTMTPICFTPYNIVL